MPSDCTAPSHSTRRAFRVSGSGRQQGPEVEVDLGEPVLGQAGEALLEGLLVEVLVAVRPLDRPLERRSRLAEHHHAVVDGEDRVALLVQRGAPGLAGLARPRLLDQCVQLVLVVHLDRPNEAIASAVHERVDGRRADHEGVAQDRRDVPPEAEALLTQRTAQQLLGVQPERETLEDRVHRLPLLTLEIGVDRHRERGALGHVGERGVERAGAVVPAAACEQTDHEDADRSQATHRAAESRDCPRGLGRVSCPPARTPADGASHSPGGRGRRRPSRPPGR